ncbi:helix-turn-helix transcriptional regulator, partial [Candidatus Fermentibacteria bacterium]|nr:helix-turn-helix transcriptional regulator [Candidatus Fermentibacteria bacterium]
VSTVSKHLSILKAAGIVRDDKRGSQVFYSLRLPCVLAFFSCVESILAGELQGQAEQTGCGLSNVTVNQPPALCNTRRPHELEG